jgi:hypothetical protein
VGVIWVLLPVGYGNGVLTGSTGFSEVDSSGPAIELEGAVGPAVGAMTVAFADGYGNGSPVPTLTELEGMGRIDTDGPAVDRTVVLLSLDTGYGIPVLAGPTAVPDGAEPVGALAVSLPAGYGAGTWVGTVGT